MSVALAHLPPRWPGFALDPARSATEPPEARGLARDEVRLLVAEPARMRHLRFRDLPDQLAAGDLVVVNTSATVAAAIDAERADGRPVTVHVSGPSPEADGSWTVELRRADATGPVGDAHVGESVRLPGGGRLRLLAPRTDHGPDARSRARLWRAATDADHPLPDELGLAGRPIGYDHLPDRWPLRHHQTVFGREPGSAEMASAARPFTDTLVTELVVRGVALAPVLLHAGVSSPERDETPPPERFAVPPATAALVEHTRARGGRVVAAGTTVARALESAVDRSGRVTAREGWTDLVLGPDRPASVVTGLITGWHGPEASHLAVLEAVAGTGLVRRAYAAALADRYRWHEFGDSCLLLP